MGSAKDRRELPDPLCGTGPVEVRLETEGGRAGMPVTYPPGGFKPDAKRGRAWCPYCGRAVQFGWDGRLAEARCLECSVSVQDFHVSRANGFGKEDQAADKFADAVKASGIRYTKPLFSEAGEVRARDDGDPAAPSWRGTDWREPAEITCPQCGRRIRVGFHPIVNVRCDRCGTICSQDGPDAPVKAKALAEEELRCHVCGRLVTNEIQPGTIYLCPACKLWRAGQGDRQAQKALQHEQENRLRVERTGPLPATVLRRVKELVRQGCADFERSECISRNYKPCVFFSETDGHRCRWFEQAVLPENEPLQVAYRRIYSTGPRHGKENASARAAEKEARQTLALAKEAATKQCSTPGCSKTFIPKGRSSRFCPDCRRKVRLASKQAYRERQNRKRPRGR